MDYDGQPQDAPDVLTRGVMTFSRGCASGRYYVSVFDKLPATKLGAVQMGSGAPAPDQDCRRDDGTQDDTGSSPRTSPAARRPRE